MPLVRSWAMTLSSLNSCRSACVLSSLLIVEMFVYTHSQNDYPAIVCLQRVSYFLNEATLSTPSRQLANHASRFWHNWYHPSFKPMTCRSPANWSRYLFFFPWHALFFCSTPNSNCFGILSSFILPRWPSHCSLLSMMKSGMDQSMPKRLARVLDVSLSCHWWHLVMPGMVLAQIVEGVEMPYMLSLQSPGLSTMQQHRHHNRPVHHSLYRQWENRVIEDRISQADKGSGSFRTALHILHDIPISQQRWTEVRERSAISISPPSTCTGATSSSLRLSPVAIPFVFSMLTVKPHSPAFPTKLLTTDSRLPRDVKCHIICNLRLCHSHHTQSGLCCPVTNQLPPR